MLQHAILFSSMPILGEISISHPVYHARVVSSSMRPVLELSITAIIGSSQSLRMARDHFGHQLVTSLSGNLNARAMKPSASGRGPSPIPGRIHLALSRKSGSNSTLSFPRRVFPAMLPLPISFDINGRSSGPIPRRNAASLSLPNHLLPAPTPAEDHISISWQNQLQLPAYLSSRQTIAFLYKADLPAQLRRPIIFLFRLSPQTAAPRSLPSRLSFLSFSITPHITGRKSRATKERRFFPSECICLVSCERRF